jgi:hypothetical protein
VYPHAPIVDAEAFYSDLIGIMWCVFRDQSCLSNVK